MHHDAQSRPTTAAALAIVGGVVAAVGGFLGWFEIEGITGPGSSESFSGIDSNGGAAALVFGVLAAAFGLTLLLRGPRTGGRGSAVTALVMAAIALGISAFAALAPETAIPTFVASDVAEVTGVSDEIARDLIEQQFKEGAWQASALIGTYVSTAGSLIALIGGILGIGYSRRHRAMAAAPAAPPPAPVPPPT
jgi:apolipoprotein N-acyltransferase